MKKLANEAQTPVTEKTDLKAQLAEVAERIRTMREIIGLSEEEMAQRTGVTLEEYRGFESGEHDFSFTFIFKCAERFGIDPTDLIKGTSPRLSTYTVTRRGEGLPITRRQGFKYLNLAPLFKGKTAEPFFVTMPYNEAEQKVAIKLSTHQGQEMDIVIKGKMRVQIGSHIEELGEGDSIYYNSGTPHGMIAVGGEECTLYAVVMRPQKEKKPEKDTFEALIKAKQDRADRETVASPFVHTELDENGILKSIDFMNEEKFNFAFDIVDKMAEKEPDKLAMLWVSKHHEEKRFTFNDMKRMSNKTANYFKSLGIKRGDRVMLILKRHYQFWFAILALHKLGAVVIPATNLLMEHDLDYRFKAAGVRALVCTPDGQVADEALRAAKNCDTVEFLMMANGAREGWLDFDAEVEKQSDVFERTEDTACSCSSPPAPRATRRSRSTTINTHSDTTSLPNTGTTSIRRGCTSPFRIPAGARRCGASSTASGCVKHPFLPMILISSMHTTSCLCSSSTTSPRSARRPLCTASSLRKIFPNTTFPPSSTAPRQAKP